MKRILEETLSNGEKRYCVQSNTLFGIPIKHWHNVSIEVDDVIKADAVFNTLEEAQEFLGLNKKVVSSKVVYIQK